MAHTFFLFLESGRVLANYVLEFFVLEIVHVLEGKLHTLLLGLGFLRVAHLLVYLEGLADFLHVLVELLVEALHLLLGFW